MSALPVASEIAAKLLAAKGVDPDPAFAETIADHPLEFTPELMESLRVAAMKAYWNATSRTAFWAGVLKGTWTNGRLQIQDWEAWGEFESTEALEAEFLARREERPTEAGAWIGWFRTKLGRDARMMEPDVALFERFFPQDHHTTLILRPSSQRPLLAAFFFRNEAGVLRPNRPERELVLVEPAPETDPVTPASFAPIQPANATNVDALAQTLAQLEAQRRHPWLRIGAGLLILSALGFGAWEARASLRHAARGVKALVSPSVPKTAAVHRLALPSADLRLQAADARHWQLSWNRLWLEQLSFSTGTLTVQQGKKTMSSVLTASELMLGSFSIPRTAEDIAVRLTVEAPGRPLIEERIRVVGQLEPMVPGAQLRAEKERNARLSQELEQLRQQLTARE